MRADGRSNGSAAARLRGGELQLGRWLGAGTAMEEGERFDVCLWRRGGILLAAEEDESFDGCGGDRLEEARHFYPAALCCPVVFDCFLL
jgi:hypothetical protein